MFSIFGSYSISAGGPVEPVVFPQFPPGGSPSHPPTSLPIPHHPPVPTLPLSAYAYPIPTPPPLVAYTYTPHPFLAYTYTYLSFLGCSKFVFVCLWF